MYQQKTSLLHLLKQNQELKIEITELRNAFNINKDILHILSENPDVNKKHFYVMLRKLNEHVYDLSEHQFEIRREKAEKDMRIKELQSVIERFQEEGKFKQALLETRGYGTGEEKKVSEGGEGVEVVEAKESNCLLMEEIKKISEESNRIKEENIKLRADNLHLKKRIKKLKSDSNQNNNSTGDGESSFEESQQSSDQAKIDSEKELWLKLQKLEKINDQLNWTVDLLSKALGKVEKVKKAKVKEELVESQDIVISMIKDRVSMDYLDYQGFSVAKLNVRGKSV